MPRTKVADGIDLDIYKRCGWTKPIESLTEYEELELSIKFQMKSLIYLSKFVKSVKIIFGLPNSLLI